MLLHRPRHRRLVHRTVYFAGTIIAIAFCSGAGVVWYSSTRSTIAPPDQVAEPLAEVAPFAQQRNATMSSSTMKTSDSERARVTITCGLTAQQLSMAASAAAASGEVFTATATCCSVSVALEEVRAGTELMLRYWPDDVAPDDESEARRPDENGNATSSSSSSSSSRQLYSTTRACDDGEDSDDRNETAATEDSPSRCGAEWVLCRLRADTSYALEVRSTPASVRSAPPSSRPPPSCCSSRHQDCDEISWHALLTRPRARPIAAALAAASRRVAALDPAHEVLERSTAASSSSASSAASTTTAVAVAVARRFGDVARFRSAPRDDSGAADAATSEVARQYDEDPSLVAANGHGGGGSADDDGADDISAVDPLASA